MDLRCLTTWVSAGSPLALSMHASWAANVPCSMGLLPWRNCNSYSDMAARGAIRSSKTSRCSGQNLAFLSGHLRSTFPAEYRSTRVRFSNKRMTSSDSKISRLSRTRRKPVRAPAKRCRAGMQRRSKRLMRTWPSLARCTEPSSRLMRRCADEPLGRRDNGALMRLTK